MSLFSAACLSGAICGGWCCTIVALGKRHIAGDDRVSMICFITLVAVLSALWIARGVV